MRECSRVCLLRPGAMVLGHQEGLQPAAPPPLLNSSVYTAKCTLQHFNRESL
jgi:hypothetical protein